jgi:hypothetical protein
VLLIGKRHEREQDRALRAQPIDQVRFRWPAERRFSDGSNPVAVT